MQVADILQSKGTRVVTTPPGAPVADISRTLQNEHIGAVLVQGQDGGIVGILSERDIVHAIASQGRSALERPVSDLMTSPVTTCSPTTELEELMETMSEGRIRHLPVVDGDRLVGIVSVSDVVKSVVEELKWVKNALRQQVITSAAWSTDED